jgi:L-alanine-DL-glutamate epimerase-like enolase superfamily enzyme
VSSSQTSRQEGLDRAAEIVEIECFPTYLPLVKPLVMSTYRIDTGPALFVRLRARCGAEGWGEAPASPVMSGDTLAGMMAAINELLAPRLLGASPVDRVMISREQRHLVHGNGGAKAAVDMALLDLAGHILGVRAVDLLGGAARRAARVLRLVGGSGVPEKDVEEACALAAQGFTAFKLKVGVAPIEREAETVRLLRDALGPDALIAADANMGWDVSQARRFAALAAPFGLAFMEQPVAPGDMRRMAAIAAGSPVPIGADEAIHGMSDILAHVEAGAIHGVSLKTIKLGGLTPLMAAAQVADALGLSVNLSMLMESSLASAAMIHAACAVPQLDWGLSLGNLFLTEDPVAAPIGCQDGLVRCPDGPGLGVVIDEARLRKLAAP